VSRLLDHFMRYGSAPAELLEGQPDRADYAPCECGPAQDEGVEECGGCQEFLAARAAWDAQDRDRRESYDPYAAADARRDQMKDEDIDRG
jgi:hypothetical protein